MEDKVNKTAEPLTEIAELHQKIEYLEQIERERKQKEAEHGEYYRQTEELVEERTAEIRIVNRQLQGEIAQRRRAEEALQVVAGQWRDTLDAINDAVWLMDLDQTIIRCNKTAARLLKKDYSKIIGKKCYELFHGTMGPIEACPFLKMYKSKHRETVRFPSEDRWFDVTVNPLKSIGGKAIGVVHVVTDVTKERRRKEELQESKMKLTNTMESITDGFFTLDRDWSFSYVNKKAAAFFNQDRQSLVGAHIQDLIPGEPGATIYNKCLEAVEKGDSVVFDLLSPLGPTWVEMRIYPSKNGFTIYFLDVTGRKKRK